MDVIKELFNNPEIGVFFLLLSAIWILVNVVYNVSKRKKEEDKIITLINKLSQKADLIENKLMKKEEINMLFTSLNLLLEKISEVKDKINRIDKYTFLEKELDKQTRDILREVEKSIKNLHDSIEKFINELSYLFKIKK